MESPDELSEHPDLADTGAAMRAEWRAEQDAATRDASTDWTHRQTLADRLRAHMHRGDRLTVVVAGLRISGVPEEIGSDLLAIRTPIGRVDIHLAAAVPLRIEVTERAAGGGHRGSEAAGGRFRHALIVREQDPRVRLGTSQDSDGVEGRLEVSADHVVLVNAAGVEIIVRIDDVAWVRRADD
jgi:hypothetical protein